ncbi:MAG: hypothetical protein ACJ8C4_19415 [Gemmataceae bacterium]
MPKIVPLPKVGAEDSPKKPTTATTDSIAANVLAALGKPTNLLHIQVKSLWANFYRVNVFVGDSQTAAVPHSYFLEATTDGAIGNSTPRITRVY